MRAKMRENEAVFREMNEKPQRAFMKLREQAEKSDQIGLVDYVPDEMYFICECSDASCTERIVLSPLIYQKIHKNRRQFIVKPGHEVNRVERMISENDEYSVVLKQEAPDAVDRE